jgi:hypothetical protein
MVCLSFQISAGISLHNSLPTHDRVARWGCHNRASAAQTAAWPQQEQHRRDVAPHTERIDRLPRQIDRQADSTTAAMKVRSTVGHLIAIFDGGQNWAVAVASEPSASALDGGTNQQIRRDVRFHHEKVCRMPSFRQSLCTIRDSPQKPATRGS